MKTYIITLLPAILAALPSLATASGIEHLVRDGQSPSPSSTITITESRSTTYTISLVLASKTITDIESMVIVSPGFTTTEFSTLISTQVLTSTETITGGSSLAATRASATTASSGAGPTLGVGGFLGVVAIAAFL